MMCTLILVLFALVTNVNSLTVSQKAVRGLNTRTYNNVLTNIGPLIPTSVPDDPMTRDENDEMVWMDRLCADQATGAQNLLNELLIETSGCFDSNPVYPTINDLNDIDYIFFLAANKSNVDCAENIIIDMEAFCISKMEYEPILHISDIKVQQDPIPWNLETMEAEPEFGYDIYTKDSYHFADFAHNNLNVYVLDTHINLNHQEFEHLNTKEFLGDGGEPVATYHGTHVAGTLIGNSVGILRDPSIGLYSYGVCNPDGCPLTQIYKGFNLTVDHLTLTKKRGIINLSLGHECGVYCDWYWTGYLKAVVAAGGIIVTAADNIDKDACLFGPAAYSEYAITVGAYDSNYRRSQFTSGASNWGRCIDAWAPGTDIYSSYFYPYGLSSGTSMASPAIAGVVGLLLSKNNDLTSTELKQILKCTEYGTIISDAQSVIDNGFSASIGDIRAIANNPQSCQDLSQTNAIKFGQLVSDSFDNNLLGEKHYYRVRIETDSTDISFVNNDNSGVTCFYFYDVNFGLMDSVCQQMVFHVTNVQIGDYWLGVSGDTGDYTIAMKSPTQSPIKSPTSSPITLTTRISESISYDNSGISEGGIIGVIVACLALLFLAGFIGDYYYNKLQKSKINANQISSYGAMQEENA